MRENTFHILHTACFYTFEQLKDANSHDEMHLHVWDKI